MKTERALCLLRFFVYIYHAGFDCSVEARDVASPNCHRIAALTETPATQGGALTNSVGVWREYLELLAEDHAESRRG